MKNGYLNLLKNGFLLNFMYGALGPDLPVYVTDLTSPVKG